MIQLATFSLPDQEQEANDFLKLHKPAGPINFNKDRAFVFYDDGTYPVEYELSDWEELIEGQRAAKRQQEIMLHVLNDEVSKMEAEFSTTHTNYPRWDELNRGIADRKTAIATCKASIDNQDMKTAFVQSKIDALRTAPANE